MTNDAAGSQPVPPVQAPWPEHQTVRPSGWWYALAGALLVAATAIGIWGGASVVLRVISDFKSITRVVMPGQAVMPLEKGSYVISHEYRSVVAGRRFRTSPELGGVTCRLVHADSGQPVALRPLRGSFHYTIGSHEGEGLWRFEVPEDGSYVLIAERASGGAAAREFVLAVGPPFPWRHLVGGILAVVGAAFLFLGAVAVFLVVIILRSKSKRRLAAQQPGG